MKLCNRCKATKPREDFNRCRGRKDGLQGSCRQCQKDMANGEYRDRRLELGRKRREENPELIAEEKRRYRASHLEKIKARDAAYYRGNSESIKRRVREYALRNPDKIKASRKDYYRRTADVAKARARQYRIDHPDKVQANKKRWIAENYEHYRNYFKVRDGRFSGDEMVPFSFDDLMGKFSMYGFKCWICGEPFEEKDHVKPVSKGGPHMLSNIKPACRRCNKSKFGKWPIDDWLVEFREKIALERE